MIDWVDFTAPLAHDVGPGTPFYAGEVLAVTPSGELEWGIYKRLELEGSHSAKIQIRSSIMSDGRQAIRVSGNLAKWFQGHNIFGTNNLHSLILEGLAGSRRARRDAARRDLHLPHAQAAPRRRVVARPPAVRPFPLLPKPPGR